jgi:hypothetical protein
LHDDDIDQRTSQIKDDIFAAIDEVGAALESGDRHRQLQAGPLLPPLIARYEALVEKLPESARERFERTVGRMLTDLRRQAGFLATQVGGQKAERAADGGGQPFLLQRTPGKSILGQDRPPARERPKYTVGDDVEAWCGKCKELRAHNIVALFDGLPKQVSCVHCKSRHGYRTEPLQRGEAAKASTAASPRSPAINAQARRQRELREKLEAELDAVPPKPFDPKDTFKTGQVIVHPKYGRGKIETVLKGSVLVRFLDGLRQISRQ